MFGAKVAFNLVDGFVEFDRLLNRNAQAQLARTASLLNEDTKPAGAEGVPRLHRRRAEAPAVVSRGARPEHRITHTFSPAPSTPIPPMPPAKSSWSITGAPCGGPGTTSFASIGDDRAVFAAMKEYTELVLTPELSARRHLAPLLRKAAWLSRRFRRHEHGLRLGTPRRNRLRHVDAPHRSGSRRMHQDAHGSRAQRHQPHGARKGRRPPGADHEFGLRPRARSGIVSAEARMPRSGGPNSRWSTRNRWRCNTPTNAPIRTR